MSRLCMRSTGLGMLYTKISSFSTFDGWRKFRTLADYHPSRNLVLHQRRQGLPSLRYRSISDCIEVRMIEPASWDMWVVLPLVNGE